jgi:hypothetical protein
MEDANMAVLNAAQRRASPKVSRTIFFIVISKKEVEVAIGPIASINDDERRSIANC